MSTSGSLHPIEILIVEDSPTDRLIAVEALRQARVLNSLNVVGNGVEAMAYLRREGTYSAALRPDLILLDLNLPRKDGREVLREIKSDPLLQLIPVVVLTSSEAEEDIARAYGLHANSYITKPLDFARFNEVIRSIENYWFEVVSLPPDHSAQLLARSSTMGVPRLRLKVDQVVEVLVIEDNPVDLLLIREALSEVGPVRFNISHVERLAEVRDRLLTASFDIVLADLGLPDSQGLDTYRQLRDCADGLPIIVLTRLDDDATGLAALREGAQDFLVKGQLLERTLARALRYAIEKKAAEDQLRQAQKMEAIGKLAAGVAHDFNNILTVIVGNANLLTSEPGVDAERVAESAREIEDAARRAATLTRQLLAFSRQQVIRITSLDLNVVVGNFATMLRRILGDDLRLELQLDANIPTANADVGMVEQIILNLAVNARDAMAKGGKLTIRTKAVRVTAADSSRHADSYAGDFVSLAVSDTGCGMSREVMARIFEPFYTTKDIGKGTGLGLATVFAIVHQHRGWIEVQSRIGAGTTFEILLPAGALPATPGTPAPNIKSERGTEVILLVEDDRTVRTLVKRVLERKGYRVIEAGSGVEAIAAWAEHHASIELLLTDMMLPDGFGGRELASKLQELKSDLKTIFSSGYSPDFVGEDALLHAGVNFLQKPYVSEDLLAIVRARLDGQ